ncbi:MAG TPA: beta-galactosidase trimerization domain-containing protein, partial [Armatimonadota bacterium]|nr:beta-galactosidase trimerization domain-containing protein [Armatimonadota bacterium]
LCYYPVCRERYRAQFGKELPVQFAQFGPQWMRPDSSRSGDPDDDRLTHFLNDTAADLARAITQAVKRSHRSAVVLYPASRKQGTPGNYDGKLEEIAQDNPSLQSLWDIGELADYEAASPVPVLYPIPPRRHTDPEVRTKMWQTLANRAYPNVESLQGTAPVFAYLKENAGYYDFAHVQPVRFLAFPRSLSDDLVQQHLAPQESATAPFLDSDRGMYSALQQAHLPIVTLHRDQLSESLQGFRVLVLADEVILSDKQIQGIIRFVREGGGLIATHETSLYDEQGRRRANFGLAALFGADYLETLPGVSTMNATAQSGRNLCFAPALGIRKPQPAPEAHVLVRPTDASVVGTLRGTGLPKGAPAILLHAFGKGRVAYLPGRQDALFARQGNSTTPALLERLVRWVSQDSVPVKVSGSGRIAVTLTDVPGHRLVHLVNQNTGSKTANPHITPLKRITVSLALPAGKRVTGAYALRARKVLDVTLNGDRAVVHLPLLGEYEAVRFDLQ